MPTYQRILATPAIGPKPFSRVEKHGSEPGKIVTDKLRRYGDGAQAVYAGDQYQGLLL